MNLIRKFSFFLARQKETVDTFPEDEENMIFVKPRPTRIGRKKKSLWQRLKKMIYGKLPVRMK